MTSCWSPSFWRCLVVWLLTASINRKKGIRPLYVQTHQTALPHGVIIFPSLQMRRQPEPGDRLQDCYLQNAAAITR